ncbi:hypothetical protein Nepgr_016321 [Nepenthes gracilis]|uniref:Uncharacterized protein n=1 Tax=Nepenthes gracilis TaxID=150966 RepID=A0AAD3SMH5_NEPGR|nr:hypothetical protein Nepgr_016321 [Nepenthes gracilis]
MDGRLGVPFGSPRHPTSSVKGVFSLKSGIYRSESPHLISNSDYPPLPATRLPFGFSNLAVPLITKKEAETKGPHSDGAPHSVISESPAHHQNASTETALYVHPGSEDYKLSDLTQKQPKSDPAVQTSKASENLQLVEVINLPRVSSSTNGSKTGTEPKPGSAYSVLPNDSSSSPMKHDREQCTVQQKSMEKAGNPANPSAANPDDCSHPNSRSELATPMAPVPIKVAGKKNKNKSENKNNSNKLEIIRGECYYVALIMDVQNIRLLKLGKIHMMIMLMNCIRIRYFPTSEKATWR